MLEVDVLLKGRKIISSSLTDAASPAFCAADYHPLTVLAAALPLMHLEAALVVKSLMTERALWDVGRLASWRVLEYGAEHGRIPKAFIGVFIIYTERRIGINSLMLGDDLAHGCYRLVGFCRQVVACSEESVLAIRWKLEWTNKPWSCGPASLGAQYLVDMLSILGPDGGRVSW